MSEPIQYRRVNADEINLYKKIRLECLHNFPENFGTLYEEELKSGNFKFEKIIFQNGNLDFLTGAFHKNSLIGICGFIQEKREKTNHVGEISQMYVTPKFTRKGIGSGLLKKTIEEAFKNENVEKIILAVAQNNAGAQKLYKKFNFVEYGRLENYFKIKDRYETQIFMNYDKKIDD